MIFYLFFVFLQIGLFSIGGGYAIIPLIQEQVVEQHQWITMQMFTDIITISQMTPGPLAVNTSTFVGLKIAGSLGAAAATTGCILAGVLISLFLSDFFQRRGKSVYVSGLLQGLKSASVGLIASAAATIVLLMLTGDSKPAVPETMDWAAVVIFSAVFAVSRKLKTNPVFLMLAAGAAGLIVYG